MSLDEKMVMDGLSTLQRDLRQDFNSNMLANISLNG